MSICSSIAGKDTRADSIFATARSMGVFSDTESSILEALLNPDESVTMIEYQSDTLDTLMPGYSWSLMACCPWMIFCPVLHT